MTAPLSASSPPRPLIGITLDHDREHTHHQLGYWYVKAVIQAGGVPMALPFGEGVDAVRQASVVDGLVLIGGNDPNPSAWGESWHAECRPADPQREVHERVLLAEASRRGIPVLGICFGMQMMNITRGGSLIQHLPDVLGEQGLEHRRSDLAGWARRHDVDITPGSTLADVSGPGRLSVNTSHHQAVGRVGEGLITAARATDGTIEAIEDPTRRFWVGVQWHPERLVEEEPRHLSLFRRLVETATVSRAEAC